MAVKLSSITRGVTLKPPRILIHGVHGVGKTTFAAGAPSPIFLPTEDGLGTLDVPTFPLLKTFEDVMSAISELYSEPHEFGSAVFDSVDWLEPIIWSEACKRNGWESIESPGYGKGYSAALDIWREYIAGCDALRNDRGMAIVWIAHTHIKRFDSPETEPYDRYQIKLNEKASALMQEKADVVLFANYKTHIAKSDAGFGKEVRRAVGRGDRVLYTSERPAFLAKNRYRLPDSMPMDFGALMAAIAAPVTQQAAEGEASE